MSLKRQIVILEVHIVTDSHQSGVIKTCEIKNLKDVPGFVLGMQIWKCSWHAVPALKERLSPACLTVWCPFSFHVFQCIEARMELCEYSVAWYPPDDVTALVH